MSNRPIRKSIRCQVSQRVQTSRLRRIRDLFWTDDKIYASPLPQDTSINHINSDEKNDDSDDDHTINVNDTEPSCKEKQDEVLHNSYSRNSGGEGNRPTTSNHQKIATGNSGNIIREKVHCNLGGRLQLHRIHSSPHIYTIHNFLTRKELSMIQEKIRLANQQKLFHKSFVDSGTTASRKRGRHGEIMTNSTQTLEEQRTSTFIHFSKLSDSVIASIENRAADLLLLPNHSIEPLQLVKYSKGQYFHDHHDMGVLFQDGSVELPKKSALAPPRRMVTILVYLNDLPDGSGGSTQFPLLSGEHGCLSIRPERNMAVIWCNLLRDGTPDQRLVHRGEVVKGECIKYAINIWACEY